MSDGRLLVCENLMSLLMEKRALLEAMERSRFSNVTKANEKKDQRREERGKCEISIRC